MKWKVIILIGFFLTVLIGGFFLMKGEQLLIFSNQEEGLEVEKQKALTNGTGIQQDFANFLKDKCESSYDSINKIMTDTSCLNYSTEGNGVINIDEDRYLAFAITGDVGVTNYKYTSMDFSWTWEINETEDETIFIGTNDHPNFIWKQYYHFYKSPFQKMKIEHYLENNLANITNAQMYYLTNILSDDTINYNDTNYLVSNYMGLHKEGNFNNIYPKIKFNGGYNFEFGDIVREGFTINEFYIGSGSVVGKPNINITAIGFTKNNGNFPKGTSVLIDPSIAFDNTDFVETTNSDSLTASNFVVGNNANRILIAAVGESGVNGLYGLGDVLSVTFNGDENFVKNIELADGTASSIEVWYLVNPTATTGDVVVTLADASDGLMLGVTSFYNIDTVNPIGSNISATANDEMTMTWTTIGQDSTLVDAISGRYGGELQAKSADSPQIELYSFSTGSRGGSWGSYKTLIDAGSNTMSWTRDPNNFLQWTGAAIELMEVESIGAFPVVTLNSPADLITYSSSQSVDFNCTAFDDFDLDNVTLYSNHTGSWVANETDTSGINNSFYVFSKLIDTFGDFAWNCYGVDNESQGAFASSNRTFSYHITDVIITDPTTASPVSVSSGDNITILFNYSFDGVNQTTGVTMENVTIGGSNAPIWGTSSQSSQHAIFFEGMESVDWVRTSGDAPADIDCNNVGLFNGCSNNGGDYEAGAGSGNPAHTGTYGLVMENWDNWDSQYATTGIWYNFDPTTACGGSACDYINLSFWWTDLAQLDGGEYMEVLGNDSDVANIEIAKCIEGACPSSYTQKTVNLSALMDDSDSVWTIRFGADMSSTSDEVFWDDINITGYISGNIEEEFAFTGGNWQVNVSVPTFESGLKDLFVNATHSGTTKSQTLSNAVNYGGVGNSCTCAGLNNNWEVSLSDDCTLVSTCDLGTGNITFTNTGSFTINATLNVFRIQAIPTGAKLFIKSLAKVFSG